MSSEEAKKALLALRDKGQLLANLTPRQMRVLLECTKVVLPYNTELTTDPFVFYVLELLQLPDEELLPSVKLIARYAIQRDSSALKHFMQVSISNDASLKAAGDCLAVICKGDDKKVRFTNFLDANACLTVSNLV